MKKLILILLINILGSQVYAYETGSSSAVSGTLANPAILNRNNNLDFTPANSGIFHKKPTEKGIVLATGGYLGKQQIGIKYNELTFLYGNTDGEEQLSLRFDYPIFEYLTVGGFVTYSLDSDTFINSPSKYESKGYYRETKMRAGLSLGLRWHMFFMTTNIHDNSLEIIFSDSYYRKNLRWLDTMFWSTAAGVIIEF